MYRRWSITTLPATPSDRHQISGGNHALAAGAVNRGWFDEPANLKWSLGLFALAYFAAVVLGNEFYPEPEGVAIFWPGSGLLLGALLVSRTRLWPLVILVALVAQRTADALLYDLALWTTSVTGLADALEALMGAVVLRRVFGHDFSLTRTREVVGLGLTAVCAPALSAIPGAALLLGGFGSPSYWVGWRTWWLANAMGVLLVTPLVVFFTRRMIYSLVGLRGRRLVELTAVVVLVGASQLVFGGESFAHATPFDVPYAVFPILVWAVIRFPPWIASACTFLLSMIVVIDANLGKGPFVIPELSTTQTVLAIQTYLAVAAFSVLALAAVLASRSRAEAGRLRSDKKYRTLFKSATDGVMVTRGPLIVDCNDRILETLRLSREEVIGKTPWDLSPATQPDGADSKKRARELMRGIEGGQSPLFEWRHIGGGGIEVDFEIGLAGAEVEDGEPTVIAHLRDITKRKAAEQVLMDSEERFRAVFEASHAGLVIRRVDDLSLVAANPALARMFGYTVAEYAQLSPEDFLTAPSVIRLGEMAETVRKGEVDHFDGAVGFRKDGSTVECETSYIPFSVKGEPHALGIIRDVTEQRRAERELRQSEEKFSKAFEAGPDALIMTSLEDNRILDVNQGFIEATGYSRDEAIGRTTVDLNLWMDISDRARFLGAVAEGEDATQFRGRLRMKSGEERIGDFSAVRLDLPGEARLLVVVRDVTDQERDRAALRESEEKFFKAFHASPSIVTITSLLDDRLMDVNHGWVRGTGYSREESIGKTTVELDLWKDPKDRARIIKRLKEEGEVHGVECRFRRKDGQETIAEVSAVPMSVEGEPRYLAVAHDLTERVQAEEQQRRALGEIARLKDALEQERDYLREEVKVSRQFGEIVGESPALRKLLDRIEAVASTDASVLIQGESGAGKELVATAIHSRSTRRNAPLVRVNCASIPHELFESEFFGHVKGAFTGAHRDRVGRFQLANHGTLFLDEIAEIPMQLQPKLLRSLQDGEIQRIGEDTTRKVNVRVVAATNRNLDEEVREGRFRQDLYYRLNVFPLRVPPLRERGEDVVLLAQYFIEKVCQQLGRKTLLLSQYQAEKLRRYDWPGNVRELHNVIERAVILSQGKRLQIETTEVDVGPGAEASVAAQPASDDPEFVPYSELGRQERNNLVAALDAANWKVSGTGGAAELLGVKASTLASKMKVMKIKKPT